MGKMTSEEKKSLGLVLFLYFIWGTLPVFWKLVHYVHPVTILSHRIIWSFVTVSLLAKINLSKEQLLEPLKSKKTLLIFVSASLIITLNWGTYIWAIVNDKIVEASMGYYINPIVMVVFGMIFFKEKLDGLKKVAILVASIGVVYIIVQYKQVPYVALTLAISFAIYGVLKKKLKVDAMVSLFYETIVVLPLALGFAIYSELNIKAYFIEFDPKTVVLLAIAGVVTVVPLILFATAVQKVKLTTLGFLQYLAPTISLLLGVLLYKETFDTTHWITFGFIWCALVIYTISNVISVKQSDPQQNEKDEEISS